MYFSDLLEPDSDRKGYIDLLGDFSQLLKDAIGLVIQGWDIAQVSAYSERKLHHSTVLVLTRHVCEMLDGVSVLATSGCAEPCQPLL